MFSSFLLFVLPQKCQNEGTVIEIAKYKTLVYGTPEIKI